MLAKRIEYDSHRLGRSRADHVRQMTPMGKILVPDDIAPMAVYLASDDARMVTGQAYNVCGGMIMPLASGRCRASTESRGSEAACSLLSIRASPFRLQPVDRLVIKFQTQAGLLWQFDLAIGHRERFLEQG